MTEAQLQLAIGGTATIVAELAPDGPRRVFAARAPHEPAGMRPSRLVVLHPAPPDGPQAGALLDRMASIRAVGHPVLSAPLATGMHDNQAWVVEAAPLGATLADRLAGGVVLPVQETVRLLREAARGLAALHRRGLHHGALDASALAFDTAGLRIHALGRSLEGTVSGDLAAMGCLARDAMMGDNRGAADGRPRRRHAVPPELAQLLDALCSDDPARRPASADAVLTALDWFPAPEQRSHRTLLDNMTRGARPPGQRRAAMWLAIAAVLLLLAWLLVRPR